MKKVIFIIFFILTNLLYAALNQKNIKAVDEILLKKRQSEIVKLTPEQIKKRNSDKYDEQNNAAKTLLALPPYSHIKKYPKLQISIDSGKWGIPEGSSDTHKTMKNLTRTNESSYFMIFVFCLLALLIFIRLSNIKKKKA